MTDVLESHPGQSRASGRAFRLDLQLSRSQSLLTLSGVIDGAARQAVSSILASLDALARAAVRVDMNDVNVIDVAGLQPLVDAARRRAMAGAAPLFWSPLSAPAQDLLIALGMAPTARVDVAAWDARVRSGGPAGPAHTVARYSA